MRRALVIAMALLMVSAGLVLLAPAERAEAWPNIRYCRVNAPAAPVVVARRIQAKGSVSCWGRGSARLTTECQLQKLQGLGARLRWTDVLPQQRGVRYWVWAQACMVTAPAETGRYRVRVRHVATGPNVVKRSGWNQSHAVTIR